MPRYEYKVVPAPAKGRKAKGLKSPESRFALAIETTLNEMGAAGWEYLRAELLPSDERSGLTSSTVNWRNVLIFRRPLAKGAAPFNPRLLDIPVTAADVVEPNPAFYEAEEGSEIDDDEDEDRSPRAERGIGAALSTRAQLAGVRRPGSDD